MTAVRAGSTEGGARECDGDAGHARGGGFSRRASAPCVGLTTPRYVTPARGGGARSKVCYAPREIAAHNPASALRLTPRGSEGAREWGVRWAR